MFRLVARGVLLQSAASTIGVSPAPVKAAVLAAQEELDRLYPRKITEILDQFIVGQKDAKKAVAVSLRNRWRRRQIEDEGLRDDITPKNILLIGPTGVGKTEIARRMAKLTDAPFVKVEATKYTEVGFKGKDVDSIIEELYTNAKGKAKTRLESEREAEALRMAQDTIFSAWSAQNASGGAQTPTMSIDEFREKCMTTDLKDVTVTFDTTEQLPAGPMSPSPLFGPAGGDDSVGRMFMGPSRRRKRVTNRISVAIAMLKQEALDKFVDESQVKQLAKRLAEQDGIVFIDEIDKVVSDPKTDNADVSSTGVQQDLLPIIEGSNVTMKDGTTISTDHILFICSGAFHVAKTSDMIAELQGRLPVRVELKALQEAEFRRILVEPKYNLLVQQTALMKTEAIDLQFTEDAIAALARVTSEVNANSQNIGARRLNTIIERVMDDYSFNCDNYANQKVEINAEVVRNATEKLKKNINLAKYLL